MSALSSGGNAQTQDSLYTGEERRNVEGFKEDLGCNVSILTGIQRRLGQKHWMLNGVSFASNGPNRWLTSSLKALSPSL